MKLDGLVSLFKDMKARHLDRIRFGHSHGRVEFDVLFFIDESPFTLMFGARGYNVAFQVPVGHGFEINPRLDKEDYKRLCDALGLVYNPANPFSVKAFFDAFSHRIPSSVPTDYKVASSDVSRFRRDVEEIDKKYFLGWLDHSVTGKNVTVLNLLKTRELLGRKFFEYCQERNVSTRWTDDQAKAIECSLPD